MNSAGIALCRIPSADPLAPAGGSAAEVLIVHPGGPFWAGKDEHAWSIPKGEFDPDDEQSDHAARREFAEELGVPAPDGPALFLGSFRAGRKTIWSWLVIWDAARANTLAHHETGDRFAVTGNEIDVEWPPRSGRTLRIPEVDSAQWCPFEALANKLHKGQVPLVSRLLDGLRAWETDPDSFTTW